jgi:uncharacterized protein YuzE
MSKAISAPTLNVRYDRASDVLYISTRPGAPARSREDEQGLVWRHDPDSGELIGVTIVDYGTSWLRRRPELIARLAGGFDMSRKDAEEVLSRIEPT